MVPRKSLSGRESPSGSAKANEAGIANRAAVTEVVTGVATAAVIVVAAEEAEAIAVGVTGVTIEVGIAETGEVVMPVIAAATRVSAVETPASAAATQEIVVANRESAVVTVTTATAAGIVIGISMTGVATIAVGTEIAMIVVATGTTTAAVIATRISIDTTTDRRSSIDRQKRSIVVMFETHGRTGSATRPAGLFRFRNSAGWLMSYE